jgi:TolB-like protein/Flp pilus assembly protein TadD
MSLFQELKRRNVIRVSLAYIVAAWLLLQIADVVINNIEAPDWVFQVIMLVIGLGFPLVVVFAWVFEMTAEGLKRETEVDRSDSMTRVTGRKLDLVIIGVLVAAVAYFAVDKFGADSEARLSISTNDSITVPPVSAADKSIAVLPFVNMSSDPEQEYFSDGISEELLNVLAQFPKLRVAARTSSFQFKGENLDIGEIAETLNVAHVLEGSVRKSGTKLRITAQLIQASDGYHLWSETYDREMDDIFAIQDEIAAAISEALKAKLELGEDSTPQPAVIQAANTQAYEAFLHGRALIHRRGRESLEDAVRFLERSLRLDANYGPAHAQLAIAITLLLESPQTYGNLSMAEVRRRAIPHIERAFEMSPNLAEAYAVKGLLAQNDGDPQATVTLTRKALAINPSYTDAMNWQQIALADLGRYAESNELIEQIVEVDPLTVVGRLNYAGVLQDQHKISEAHKVGESLAKQSPWAAATVRARVSLYSEADISQGLFWILQAFAADPGDLLSNFVLVDAFNWVGLHKEASRVTDTLRPIVYLAQGRADDAVNLIVQMQQSDPDNNGLIGAVGRVSFGARHFDVAKASFEKLASRQPAGRPLNVFLFSTIHLAYLRRLEGDEEGANVAIEIVRDDYRAQEESGSRGPYFMAARALLAAYDGDTNTAVDSLRAAVDAGLRAPPIFNDAVFDSMRDDQRFIDIESTALQALAEEREKALQLICFNNPAPGAWQPLPETCEGVEEAPLEI